MSTPTILTTFVGREHETADVARLLSTSRLVTLIGAAGCGKTRIAQQIAATVGREHPDGVRWVELARLADPRLVERSVARALDVRERPETSLLLDELPHTLHDRQMLLVLDNCEHLLSACAAIVEPILATSNVTVLATSREPLRVTGELRYPVAPMSVPPPSENSMSVRQYDAVQLFIERVRAVLPDFDLTNENAGMVAHICRRLDGIPLSIELASARINILSLEQVAERLDRRMEPLPPAPGITTSQHATLRAALDWSYDLLSSPEQTMLRRFSAFSGSFSLATAEAVCTGDGVERHQILGLLTLLVEKSLVRAETLRPGEARYTLLETIRHYAGEKLTAARESLALRDRHFEYFLAMTETSAEKLTGPDQHQWLDHLEDEYDNIRSAMTWSLNRRRIEDGLRMAVALFQFWTVRDYSSEALSWLDRLLRRVDGPVAPAVRAKALANAAFLAGFRGDVGAQLRYGRQASELAKSASDEDNATLAWALAAQAHGARAEGDYRREFTLAKQVIALFRGFDDSYILGLALSTYSFTAMSLGEYAAARELLDEGLELLRKVGNPHRIAMALNFSGDLARCERDYRRAQRVYEESASILKQIGAERDLASALHNLGHTRLRLGDFDPAHSLFAESLTLHLEHRHVSGAAECLIGFAAMASVTGRMSDGARLLAAAVAIGGERIASTWPATRIDYEHYLAQVRNGLTETEFQTEQEIGRALSLEHAVALALRLPLGPGSMSAEPDGPDNLTAREREIAVLIAAGKSNGKIAEDLILSKRTIETHVSNIRSKLGATERTQIVRWVVDSGLLDVAESSDFQDRRT